MPSNLSKKENWEKEFDEEFKELYHVQIVIRDGIPDKHLITQGNLVKSFIRNLLEAKEQQVAEEIIEMLEIENQDEQKDNTMKVAVIRSNIVRFELRNAIRDKYLSKKHE